MNLSVMVEIKRAVSHETVKSFSFIGAQRLDVAMLWIWRDLFLSMLAYGRNKDKKKIPQMLREIEDFFGWSAVQRILSGGDKCKCLSTWYSSSPILIACSPKFCPISSA